jgi:hypothetical protein
MFKPTNETLALIKPPTAPEILNDVTLQSEITAVFSPSFIPTVEVVYLSNNPPLGENIGIISSLTSKDNVPVCPTVPVACNTRPAVVLLGGVATISKKEGLKAESHDPPVIKT